MNVLSQSGLLVGPFSPGVLHPGPDPPAHVVHLGVGVGAVDGADDGGGVVGAPRLHPAHGHEQPAAVEVGGGGQAQAEAGQHNAHLGEGVIVRAIGLEGRGRL